ncbi:MurT ligase domain-containing protein [Saccharomonospora sp. NPDC046836]|uniref:MurT ligase domain-containing protein n=1 Tax=Saccharomonospora sp. NPDC046836 TaxID=3156921 RepID=UPI0033CEB49D
MVNHHAARQGSVDRSLHPGARSLPLRTRAAIAAGRFAAAASRRTGRGGGGMIGGRTALALAPEALRHLGTNRTVVIVTGTNGKTTTSLMLSRILSTLGPVAANGDGANMPDGVLAALMAAPHAEHAVLEVDEYYVPLVAERVRPAGIVLLNLSRDQLDRAGEVRMTERDLRAAVSTLPDTFVVANCDDPLVTSAARDAAQPVWVGAGQLWHDDGTACARCGQAIRRDSDSWSCVCGLARPEPEWTLNDRTLAGPGNLQVPLDLRLPGRANAANAAIAVAAAAQLGVSPTLAAGTLRAIDNVGGRYREVSYAGHTVRVLLAKNPAGWGETLPLLNGNRAVVIAVNSREPDGRDMSWLWDVPFEVLRGRHVVAAGERATDLAVRLSYAEVEHTIEHDPLRAVRELDTESVDLVGNYTAFRDVIGRLRDA